MTKSIISHRSMHIPMFKGIKVVFRLAEEVQYIKTILLVTFYSTQQMFEYLWTQWCHKISLPVTGRYPHNIIEAQNFDFLNPSLSASALELWGAKKEAPKKAPQAPQAPFKAPMHSKCCIGGFRETGLALVIVLRCDRRLMRHLVQKLWAF